MDHFFTSSIFYFVSRSTQLSCFSDYKSSFIYTTAENAFHPESSFFSLLLLLLLLLLLVLSFSLFKSAPGQFPAILSDAHHEEAEEHKARWVPFHRHHHQ